MNFVVSVKVARVCRMEDEEQPTTKDPPRQSFVRKGQL